jgi:phosphatidylglycerophosphate synthase
MSAPLEGQALGESIPTADATHEEKLRRLQKKQDAVSVYFARLVSRRLTPLFLKTGMSANQATAVWGLLSLLNSYVIYLAMTGAFWLAPLVFALYFVVVVVDCVDGEIARYRNTASPIGGKLLDGVWHKATEYSLLIAYVAGVHYWRPGPWILPLGLTLLAGEAMYTYVYERRLTVIRVFAKSSEYINPTHANDLYRRDEPWRDFPAAKKLNAFKGLIQYKSVYFMIALSLLPADFLMGGLVLLAVYKHFAWIKLLVRTVNRPPAMDQDA